jgi:hypothetical protein
MAKQHVYDQVASDLAQWLDDTSKQLADDMRDGGKAPFSANATEAEKLRYYEQQLYNADGSSNDQGRSGLLNRLGTTNYAQLLMDVGKARNDRAALAAGTMPETPRPMVGGE